jgi:hypothetical protein
MKQQRVERLIVWYEKDPGDALVGECELKGIRLEDIRKLFNEPEDDPLMYYCYEVKEAHVPFLQPYCDHRIDLEAYDYRVEAAAVD